MIIVPSGNRDEQVRLFSAALNVVIDLEDDLVNKIIEVLLDGSVHVREWTSAEHDMGHVTAPSW
jgi:hypothetical protein